MRPFYEQSLWILQHFLLTNPDLHHRLLSGSGGVCARNRNSAAVTLSSRTTCAEHVSLQTPYAKQVANHKAKGWGNLHRIGRPGSDHIHGSQVSPRERSGANASRFVLRSRATARSEHLERLIKPIFAPRPRRFQRDRERREQALEWMRNVLQGAIPLNILTKELGGVPLSELESLVISGHRRKTLDPK